jgi:hypothetical protein
MIPYRQPLIAGILGLATLISGLLLGQASGRWGAAPAVVTAEQSLGRRLPERTGNWRLRKEQELEPEVVKMMQCNAYIARVYEHDQTGDLVTVAVLVGPAGPISVHTPEICYSSRDYVVGRNRVKTSVDDTAGRRHGFWDVTLKARDSESSTQRVLYAWSTGDAWNAAAHPRFAYAGSPYLYKLQLAARSSADTKRDEFDPCQDFLRSFLTQCQTCLRTFE